MRIKYYIVDVFTKEKFKGNPAAVCLLEEEISTELQQKIASEINLSETAFIIKNEIGYDLRWFTPKVEVDLCGHATLATGYILFEYQNIKSDTIAFHTLSGTLTVTKKSNQYWLNLPKREVQPIEHFKTFDLAFGKDKFQSFKANDFMLVFDFAEDVASFKPDFGILKQIKIEAGLPDDVFGIIVTAKGDSFDCDFVSRFFAPNAGIDEDPVTGRAHSSLIPYWSKTLNKKQMNARQLSHRQGYLSCINNNDDTVSLGAEIQIFSEGTMIL